MASIKAYELSKEADRDLEEIFEYTINKFGLNQAVKYLNEFEVLFSELIINPDMGKNRNEIKSGLKSFSKSAHVVFYRIQNDKIRIVRVLHGSRDVLKFFDE